MVVASLITIMQHPMSNRLIDIALIEFVLVKLIKIAKSEKRSTDLTTKRAESELIHPIDSINLFEYFHFTAKATVCRDLLKRNSILSTLYSKVKHLKYLPIAEGSNNDQKMTTKLRKYAKIKIKKEVYVKKTFR